MTIKIVLLAGALALAPLAAQAERIEHIAIDRLPPWQIDYPN